MNHYLNSKLLYSINLDESVLDYPLKFCSLKYTMCVLKYVNDYLFPIIQFAVKNSLEPCIQWVLCWYDPDVCFGKLWKSVLARF